MKVLYYILIFSSILLACKSLSFRNKLDARSEENMKLTAFTIAKNYLLSFTPYKKSNVALASREKESNSNNIII
jgi:hypothetical protein